MEKLHHSLSDWDFRSGLGYALDNSIYVSAPSALRISTPTTGTCCLLRDSACLNLPQGRLESYWRVAAIANSRCTFEFRQQSALGSLDYNNTYLVRFASTTAFAVKRVAAVETALGSWVRAHANNTWYRERITWWIESAVLLIRYEYWDGSSWQIVGTDITDPSPSFGGSSRNRLGLGVQVSVQAGIWYDDTIIYGPV